MPTLLSAACAAAAISTSDLQAARLSQVQQEVMNARPAPELLKRIPAVVDLSRSLEQSGQPGKAGAALNYAVIYALMGGDLARAITMADRAAALCTAAKDQRCYGNAMNQSAIALLRLNDPYAAMQRLKRGALAFVKAGDPERAAIARLNSANIRYDIGDYSGALADYSALDKAHGADAGWDAVGLLTSKARVLVKLNRLDEARRTALRAMIMLKARARSKGTRWESDVGSDARGTMALVEASLGNAAAALPLYRENLAAAERSQSPLELHNANYGFAEGLMKLGRPAEADRYIRQALDRIEETSPAGRRDAHDLASQIAADLGDSRAALAHLRAAEQIRNQLSAATLRSAVADANAQTAVAEREAQLARRDAEWATQRTRLLAWLAVAVVSLILAGVTVLIRLRARAIEQRYAAVLSERTRMARELHDTLLQGFTGITMQLRAAARSDPLQMSHMLADMADQAGRWLSETRHAVWDMRATTAGDDLRAGLEQAIATAARQTSATIHLDYQLARPPGSHLTGALLRVSQEALSNAGRHAQASRIDIVVRSDGHAATLAVSDNGVGFKAAPELSALGGHWGLLGMRERVEMLGGRFRVETALGKGTRIVAEVPL